MSKKQNTSPKAKKNIKPVKKQVASKKAQPAKPSKNIANKKKAKPVKAIKKAIRKIVVKKSVKPAKPARPSGGKVASKPIRKPNKPLKLVKKAVAPKASAKPVKPGKIEVIIVKPKADKSSKNSKPLKTEKSAGNADPSGGNLLGKDKKPLGKPTKGKGGRKPKSKNDDDEPEIVHDELIEQLILSTKRKKSSPKVPKILKTFVNPITSLSLASDEIEKKGSISKKEPKGKFELEYVIRTSAGILYEFITTPSGLSEWFADDVNIRDGIFTFFWDGSEQKAKLLGFKEEKFIRLRWIDKPEGTYFEFRIERDELTGDISLIIIDFADEVSDMQTSKLLWDSQVNKLLGVLGSN